MSKRKKSVRRATVTRGPSRAIDPRRAPGQPQRRGMDGFAVGLIVTSTLAVLLVVGFIALQSSNASPGTSQPSAASGPSVTPNWTQTTVVFSTQTAPDILPRITIQDTKALYDSGNVKIIDVRDTQFYTQGHIKGAVNVPHGELGSRIKDVPRSGNLVLYCECPHDEESASVAFALKSAGYTNMKILEGPTALTLWKNAGYPVEP